MTGPTASGPQPQERGPQLNAREAEIFRALSSIDPVLGGVFEDLVHARREVDRPGRMVRFSHLMREVSNGVARHLSGWGFPTRRRDDTGEVEPEPPDDEKHRELLAAALGKPRDHPAVTIWFKLHNAFRRSWHYWHPLPPVPKATEAYDRFIDILWGLIGPFFETVKDLEPFLAIDSPSADDVIRLHAVLARPAQRAQFFQRLQHPAWVEPLRVGGFFEQPPDANQVDGRWSWDLWPEGDYLVRMTDSVPEDVERALLTVPPTSSNPMVWLKVAKAAQQLPRPGGARLSKLLATPVKEGLFRRIYADEVGELALQLAEQKQIVAFPLTRALLYVTKDPERQRSYLRGTTGAVAEVGALTPYSLGRLLPRLIPALEQIDVKQTLECFSHLLAAALSIEFGSDQDFNDKSLRWAKNLEATDPREEDNRELLAVMIAGVATRWAARDSVAAAEVVSILRKQPWQVFRRIEMYVVAQVGPLLQEDLDRAVGDESAIAEDYPVPEYRLIIERQFSHASASAQARHVAAIENGPGTVEDLSEELAHLDGSPFTRDDAERHIIRWQRKRLRRFDGHLPESLKVFRDKIDSDARVPPATPDEIELEDAGGSGRVFSWVGPGSPIPATELASRSPAELVEIFRTFRPAPERWDSPTPAGLARAVEEAVAGNPALGEQLLERMRASWPDATYVRAVLQALGQAVDAGKSVSWPTILPVLQWVAEQVRGGEQSHANLIDYADANWDEAKRAAARLIFRSAQKGLLQPADRDAAWAALNAFIQNPSTWQGSERNRNELVENVDAALMLALNHLGGDVADSFVQLALWTYRLDEQGFDPAPLRAGLDTILDKDGREAYGARTMLGRYVPWLLLMDRTGTTARLDRLFAGEFGPPRVNAGWGGYVTSQHFFASLFEELRPWYMKAALALPEDRSGGVEADRTWSPTRHLISHLGIAWLSGVASVDDQDELVKIAFARAASKDIAHFYWEIFRGWTDSSVPPDRERAERLLSFWKWRLQVLESLADTPERTEELSALGWLALIPWLSDAEVLPLLERTTDLVGGRFVMEHTLWERVGKLVLLEPDRGFAIAARILEAVMSSDYPFLNPADVRPVLQHALAAGSVTTKQAARDLINRLGERGIARLDDLLP